MDSNSSYALRLTDFSYAWPGQPALFHVASLSLPQGQHLFIQGPSGCGKSTFLSLIAGVQSVQSGECMVLEKSMASLSPTQRDRLRGEHMGVIFQQFNLLPYLGIQANLLLPVRMFASRAQASAQQWGDPVSQARALSQSLGLPDSHWNQPVHQLSVGQQQRVAAARALMGAPRLVIADEPTSALDETHQDEFLNLLLSTADRQKASVVMVSHNPRLAERFHQVLSLSKGEVT